MGQVTPVGAVRRSDSGSSAGVSLLVTNFTSRPGRAVTAPATQAGWAQSSRADARLITRGLHGGSVEIDTRVMAIRTPLASPHPGRQAPSLSHVQIASKLNPRVTAAKRTRRTPTCRSAKTHRPLPKTTCRPKALSFSPR